MRTRAAPTTREAGRPCQRARTAHTLRRRCGACSFLRSARGVPGKPKLNTTRRGEGPPDEEASEPIAQGYAPLSTTPAPEPSRPGAPGVQVTRQRTLSHSVCVSAAGWPPTLTLLLPAARVLQSPPPNLLQQADSVESGLSQLQLQGADGDTAGNRAASSSRSDSSSHAAGKLAAGSGGGGGAAPADDEVSQSRVSSQIRVKKFNKLLAEPLVSVSCVSECVHVCGA